MMKLSYTTINRSDLSQIEGRTDLYSLSAGYLSLWSVLSDTLSYDILFRDDIIMKMFLNPNKSLYTCKADDCEECGVSKKLVCHFNAKQLALFLTLSFPLFICAGYFIYKFNPYLLIPWIIFVFSYFGLIEIRVMCSHCPHYAEPGTKTLKCWANYGSPKLWSYRPGPMSVFEKIVFFSGFVVILFPPIVLLIVQRHYISLIIYIALLVAFKIGLKTLYCRHCMNFACPFNVVDDATTNIFFEKNPGIKAAWGK